MKNNEQSLEGEIEITSTGAGYVTVEGLIEDVYIPPRNVLNALNGDTVRISLAPKNKKSRQEGIVTDVLKRARTDFVGRIQVSEKFAFLVTDDTKMPVDIMIPLRELNGALDGQKALVRMAKWLPQFKNPEGSVIKVLGNAGENETEMNAIIAEYGFPLGFPADVEAEAEKISEEISQIEIAKRRDFRSVPTFTIDPVDAKDFDDALSVRQLKDGNWEIGVHIADVSHYILENTALEEEAFYRATSIYLVDRVIPMLPEKLSNGLCSLRPNEDKLCFSAVFTMDANAKVLEQWFGRTIIHSNRRFTYEEAQLVIETNEGDMVSEILTLYKLSKILRKQRFAAGAISFEKIEVKFNLDEKGNPVSVYFKESKDSNKLIEEFMLLANRKVAEFIGKPEKSREPRTFVYRVHDIPVGDKLGTFSAFIGKFGYKMNTQSGREIARSLNHLMEEIKGKREENIIETLAIRTMAKATYTTKNIGHYGLAFDYYTHFTSPIRRYPDIMVHRLLQRYLDKGKSVDDKTYEDKCAHSTDMEIRAAEAERTSVKYKQVQFLQGKLGQVFEGLISGVTEWGVFVEIVENKCEGLIRLRDMKDDFYEFDASNYCIIGRRSGRKYQLGDNVKIRVKKADLIRRQIDFELAEHVARNEAFEWEKGADKPKSTPSNFGTKKDSKHKFHRGRKKGKRN